MIVQAFGTAWSENMRVQDELGCTGRKGIHDEWAKEWSAKAKNYHTKRSAKYQGEHDKEKGEDATDVGAKSSRS